MNLFIDTSSKTNVLAFYEGEKLIQSFLFPQADEVVSRLQEALKVAGLSLSSLKYITLGTGPGSYTGIRLGAVICQSLSKALNIPLNGFSSLKMYAGDTLITDAKIGGFYLLLDQKPLMLSLQEMEKYKSLPLYTPDFENMKMKLPEFNLHKTEINFSKIGKEAHRALQAGAPLELLYLRKTQAEIEKEALNHRDHKDL